MKKEYTKPTVVKVKLNHEQAVLGVCSSTAADTSSATPSGACRGSETGHPYCKQSSKAGNSAATS